MQAVDPDTFGNPADNRLLAGLPNQALGTGRQGPTAPPAGEDINPPANIARAADILEAGAPPHQAPPAYTPRAPRPRVGNQDRPVDLILYLSSTTNGPASEEEMRRAYAMIAAHQSTPAHVIGLLLDMAQPINEVIRPHLMPGDQRRAALAALMGIRVGFATQAARDVVDQARKRHPEDVLPFIGEHLTNAAAVGLNGYAAYLLGARALGGAGAKAAALKVGGLGIGGTVKAGAAFLGWSALGVVAGVWGATAVFRGMGNAGRTFVRYEDLLEPAWYQDRRILEGILQAIVLEGHPARLARQR